jgi:hypothetical protein
MQGYSSEEEKPLILTKFKLHLSNPVQHTNIIFSYLLIILHFSKLYCYLIKQLFNKTIIYEENHYGNFANMLYFGNTLILC